MLPTRNRVPAYRRHKPSGQAVVTLGGRDVYLGAHGSDRSRAAYERAVAEWLSSGRATRPPGRCAARTVDELLVAFFAHARMYYRRTDGSTTSEYDNFRDAVRPLQRLYGSTPVDQFGPLRLKALRGEMIRLRWARSYINKQIGRVKRVFRHGVENELVEPRVHQALQAVDGLRAGRSDAREAEPVRAVDR